MDWDKAQEWEKEWWSSCQNTFGEEEKQLVYAEKMGLQRFHNGKSPYNFDLQGKNILDIGGGAVSLLLKCVNFTGDVVDPLPNPEWVKMRYTAAAIGLIQDTGEDFLKDVTILDKNSIYDEVWIYNCLQHTKDPKKIIDNARKIGKLIRIFEWINTEKNIGHPQVLHEPELNTWLHGEGKVEMLNKSTLKGLCYYGIFPTK